jgi:hypothetical protein
MPRCGRSRVHNYTHPPGGVPKFNFISFPLYGGRLGWGCCASKDALTGIIPTLTLPYLKGRGRYKHPVLN